MSWSTGMAGTTFPWKPLKRGCTARVLTPGGTGRSRREWVCFVGSVAGGLAAVALIVAALAGMSLLKFVLVTAAGLRLAAWLLTEQRAQSTAKSRMEKLRGFLSPADAPDGTSTLCDIRLVQASIFEHRRLGPMVHDWFHELGRAGHEALERS